MKVLILATTLILAPVLFAQEPAPISVAVGGDDESVSAAVVQKLKAKIGSTNRYSVVDGVADLDLNVSCVRALVGGKPIGVACGYFVQYAPKSVAPLLTLVDAGEVTCGDNDGASCAEHIFDDFVVSTQAAKLIAAETTIRQSVDLYVAFHPAEVLAIQQMNGKK